MDSKKTFTFAPDFLLKNVMNIRVFSVKSFIIYFLVYYVLVGCVSTKSIIYFQPIHPTMDEEVTSMLATYTPKIKPGDILSIMVNGLDRDDREIFNPPYTITQYPQTGGFIVLQPIRGFTVDSLGCIDFPQIGKMEVAGLTTNELGVSLTEQLQEFFISPTVSVNIANFIISVLGEVTRPAQYVLSNNQITLPEALALAGDLTIYGKRENILVIREMEGQRFFARVDLTDRSLFTSPYYYLRAGDLIYVEPKKGRLTSTDRTYQLAPILISSLSFLMLLLNTIIKK